MSGLSKNDNLGFWRSLKKAFADKDWLTLVSLAVGIFNIILACLCLWTGFTKGIISIVLGFANAVPAMLALDKTKNSVAIAGALCGFVGMAIGVIGLFVL